MAMDVGAGKSGPKSDINVTPLVDVMLVLLIIMMIVAPMLQKGVDVRLPVASNRTDKPETQDQTIVAVKADKTVYVNSQAVPMNDLRRKLEEALETKSQRIVFIKADKEAPYGAVMEAMDQLRAGGIEDMALIADPKGKGGSK